MAYIPALVISVVLRWERRDGNASGYNGRNVAAMLKWLRILRRLPGVFLRERRWYRREIARNSDRQENLRGYCDSRHRYGPDDCPFCDSVIYELKKQTWRDSLGVTLWRITGDRKWLNE